MTGEQNLKREIGTIGLSANLVNIMVGAGIFVLPAVVAASLGSASIFAYLFCGFLISLVMLCFAEVGSQISASGGAYAYIGHSFGPYFGFLTAVLFATAAISADAAVANAIADIFGSLHPSLATRVFKTVLFIFIFGGLAYINVKGVKNSVKLVQFITMAKLAPLLLLVIFSWLEVSLDNLVITSLPALDDIGKTSLILFFAFQGGESGLSVSGEVKNPATTVPRAILISIGGVLLLYMLIQTVSQGVLGSDLSTFHENPLSEVANQLVGPIGFTLITIGAAVSMLGNLSSEILSIPRILFGAASDRVLPLQFMARVHPIYGTPHLAILVYAGMGFLFASLGGFTQMAIVSSTAILLVYLGVVLSVVKLRRSKRKYTKGFKIPGGLLVPGLATLVIVAMVSTLSKMELLAFAATLVALSLIYYAIKSKKPA